MLSEDFWILLVAIGLFAASLYNVLTEYAIMAGRLY